MARLGRRIPDLRTHSEAVSLEESLIDVKRVAAGLGRLVDSERTGVRIRGHVHVLNVYNHPFWAMQVELVAAVGDEGDRQRDNDVPHPERLEACSLEDK